VKLLMLGAVGLGVVLSRAIFGGRG
jgi:hypothetical protein